MFKGLLVIVWFPAWLSGCGDGETHHSAILITLDTTRADVLSCYSDQAPQLINIDRLAAEGITFDAAYSVAPLTLPAHCSMLTGLIPPRHTVRENGFHLPSSAWTLAEAASEGGLQTGAFVAAQVLSDGLGLGQGFDVYDLGDGEKQSGTSHIVERRGNFVVEQAIAWLKGRDRSRPFFLWVHLFDPHGPYDPPAEFFRGSSVRQRYAGEVLAADHFVGRLLEFLRADGALSEATTLLLADHGESFDEHSEPTHGVYCYDTTLRIPMILRRRDGQQAGERSNRLVSVVDVYPTLLEAMRLPVRGAVEGRSLLGPLPKDRCVYLESYSGYLSYGWSPLAGVVDAEGKYLHSSRPQLFDPWSDPTESVDLAADRPEQVVRYRRLLAQMTSRPALVADSGGAAAGEDLLDAIRRLGYAAVRGRATNVPGPLDPSDRRAPADAIELYRKVLFGQELYNQGRLAEAEELLRQVLEVDPDNFVALDRFATCLMRQDRLREAIEPLTRLLKHGPWMPGSHYNLGICLVAAGRTEDAIERLKEAVQFAPGQALFLSELQKQLRAAGREAEAAAYEALGTASGKL